MNNLISFLVSCPSDHSLWIYYHHQQQQEERLPKIGCDPGSMLDWLVFFRKCGFKSLHILIELKTFINQPWKRFSIQVESKLRECKENIWTPASIRAQPESFGQARQDPVEQKCKNIKKAKIFEMFTQKKTFGPQSLLRVFFIYLEGTLSYTPLYSLTYAAPLFSVQTSRQLKQQFPTQMCSQTWEWSTTTTTTTTTSNH